MKNLYKHITASFLLMLVVSFSKAQQVLMSQTVDTVKMNHPHYGPNERDYVQSWLGFGFMAGQNPARMPIVFGRSAQFAAGMLYKRKLSPVFSLGATLGYTFTGIALKKTEGMSITDSVFWGSDVSHKKERFGFESLAGRLFLRVNFDPHRGEVIGNYLDLGGGTDFMAGQSYVAVDKREGGIKVKSHFSRLSYANPFQNYVYAKIGYNFLGISCQYRLTKFFKDQYNFPDLPPFMIRLEVSLLN